jgi:hypothetical protein
MGTITRSFANNITTSGVLLPASLNNNSIANVTAYNAAIATGGMKLISTQTASNSASISFTTGIDSTYKEYQFYFINVAPKTDSTDFTFQGSTNGGSSYGVNITSTAFRAHVSDDGTSDQIIYLTSNDLAQSTSFQLLNNGASSDANDGTGGTLTLFNPASTTYVKHWIYNNAYVGAGDACMEGFYAGYFNTTTAINAVQFKFSSGNMDGTILMYGIV